MLVYPLFIVGSRLHHLNEMSCDAFKFAPCAIPVFRSVAAVHNFMRFGAKNFAALHATAYYTFSVPLETASMMGMVVTLLIRLAAIRWHLKLPTFALDENGR